MTSTIPQAKITIFFKRLLVTIDLQSFHFRTAMYRSHAIIVRWISEQNDKANISIAVLVTAIKQKSWTATIR